MAIANNNPHPESRANPLKRLAYFVAVVETGSFTAAAERLGITKAVVSQQVARLEQEVRTSLLVRTTRRVRATEAGQVFYSRCALILKEAEEAFAQLAKSVEDPVGVLRLTAPYDYGVSALVPLIAAFSQRYPRCQVEARFSDHVVDLTAEAFDLAIRVGWVTEQHLPARRIGGFEQRLVAGPQWRAQLASVKAPEDLARLPVVANTALSEPTKWVFTRDGQERRVVNMLASLQLNATVAVREAVLCGAGLAVLPDYSTASYLAQGLLVEVLPEWRLPSGDIQVVFPPARYRPAKVRAFVDLLVRSTGLRPSGGSSPG